MMSTENTVSADRQLWAILLALAMHEPAAAKRLEQRLTNSPSTSGDRAVGEELRRMNADEAVMLIVDSRRFIARRKREDRARARRDAEIVRSMREVA